MGLSIGQSLGFFQPARVAPQIQRADRGSETTPRVGFSIDSAEDSGRSNPFNRPERSVVQIGFGENTISGPSAAAIALNRGLRSARRIVPPLPQEGRDFGDRISQQREARAERSARAVNLERAERNRVVVTNQARNFINDVNEAAGVALARVRGDAPAEASGASIEVGGRSFRFGAVGAASDSVTFTDGEGRIRIDAFV